MRALSEVHPLVLYYLVVQVIYLPVAMYRAIQKQKTKDAVVPTFRQICRSAILGISLYTTLALMTAYAVNLPLFRPWRPSTNEILIGIAMLFGWFVIRASILPWLRKGAPQNNMLRFPTTWRQLALWGVVSIVAGVGEEIIYRGVLYDCLGWVLHQNIVAAVISALVFSYLHVGQGWKSGVFIFILALTFQWLVSYAGSLYMAMLIHATYDLAVGLQHVLAVKRQQLS